MELRFSIHGKIRRPVAEVFQAVNDPAQLASYFATGGASAPLAPGRTVTWRWHDFPQVVGEVKVREVVPNERIVFEWEASDGGYDTRVEMTFEPLDAGSTLVRITESGWKETPEGLKASYGNCEGWTAMLCALKVWVEQGVNIREFFY
jgi:uncharacterized protein YndB with AHSA1/START domain